MLCSIGPFWVQLFAELPGDELPENMFTLQ